MGYQNGHIGHMTNDVTWLQRCCEAVVGYPSDSLASSFNSPAPRAVIEFIKCWCKWDCSGARCCFKNALPFTPPPRCASATKGYVTTKLEMSMAWPWGWWWWQWVTVAVHIITVFVTCWAVLNHTISLLSNSMLAVLWFHWKRRWQFFKQSWLCVYMLSAAAIHDKGLTTCQLKINTFLILTNV